MVLRASDRAVDRSKKNAVRGVVVEASNGSVPAADQNRAFDSF
jgi:hypothetical protein